VTGYFDKKYLVDRTNEYKSPNFHERQALVFLTLLLGTMAAAIWSRRRVALHEGLLLFGFAVFALHSVRNVPLFAIVAAPILATQLAALPHAAPLGARWARLRDAALAWLGRRNAAYARMDAVPRLPLWPVLALAGLVWLAAAQQRAGEAPLGQRFYWERQPVGAAAYLKAYPPSGNGFNQFGWGGYLLHQLWPQQRVFIDGQTDFYGVELTKEYASVSELQEDWQDVLRRHDVQWVVFATDTPLVRALAAMPDWTVAYRDEVATVLLRTSAPAAHMQRPLGG
jgi:hypothetical protein